MNLHNEIMNIPVTSLKDFPTGYERTIYKEGHRDARHAAAELALKAEARIEELKLILRGALGIKAYKLLEIK